MFKTPPNKVFDTQVKSDSNRFYTRHGFVVESQSEFDTFYVRRSGNSIQHCSRRGTFPQHGFACI